MKQQPQAEPKESGSSPQSLQSASPQSEAQSVQGWPPASMPQGWDLEHMGLGNLQRPPSHSISEVQDSHEETPGPGHSETGPRAPYSSSQAACGISSGPKGTWGHRPPLLPLEVLMGSIQVFEHLQQAASCFSLPVQGFRTGPWAGDEGATGAQAGQGRWSNPRRWASRFALCPENPNRCQNPHTQPPGPRVGWKQESDLEGTGLYLASAGTCQRARERDPLH